MDISESTYFINSDFFKQIIIELIKGGFTFLLGLISFKIFEGYRNRKDNNKLYIQIIKLEKELNENKSKIEDILNEYKEMEKLEEKFYIDGVYSDELYKLYNDILQISYDYIRDGYYNDNEPIWDKYYCEVPYRRIEEITYEIMNLEAMDNHDIERIRDLKELLEVYENRNIYDGFIDIQQRVAVFWGKEFNFKKPIRFLNNVLNKFNLLIQEEKNRKLQSFCAMLFEGENSFADSLRDFKRLKQLKRKQSPKNKNSRLDIDFNIFDIDDMDLLVFYNAEVYLELHELYSKLSQTEVHINQEIY